MQVSFLHDVPGFIIVRHHATRRAKQQAVVAPHDGFEGGGVAGASACEQIGVRSGINGRWHRQTPLGTRLTMMFVFAY